MVTLRWMPRSVSVHKGVAGVPVAPFVVLWMFVTDVFACW